MNNRNGLHPMIESKKYIMSSIMLNLSYYAIISILYAISKLLMQLSSLNIDDRQVIFPHFMHS